MKIPVLKWLNTALVVNFFLVLVSFFWFVIAVAGRSFEVPLGFDLWYRLWQPLFQPAIGLLMVGAIVSGISSWLHKKIQTGQQKQRLDP